MTLRSTMKYVGLALVSLSLISLSLAIRFTIAEANLSGISKPLIALTLLTYHPHFFLFVLYISIAFVAFIISYDNYEIKKMPWFYLILLHLIFLDPWHQSQILLYKSMPIWNDTENIRSVNEAIFSTVDYHFIIQPVILNIRKHYQ